MISSKFTQIDSFSYLPNGKIDRKNVNVLTCHFHETNDMRIVNGLSDLQQKAFDIIKSNLDESVFPNINIDADLTSAGINSIMFIKIAVSLETEFDFEFDDEMLLFTAFSTLRSITEYVELKTLQLLEK